MKGSVKFLLIGAMALMLGACGGGEKQTVLDTNRVYKVGTTAEYPPFETLENGKIVGYDVDVIDAVAKKIGIKYEWKDMNFDGLKDDIIKLLARKRVIINASKFQNDMTTFQSKDDVFTLLVHLGYLGYDEETSEVYIPNNEVVESFVNSIEDSNWGPVSESLRNSMNLIQATYACDGEQVAEYIEKAHLETSILQYNDENALAYTIYLAYIMARNDYTMVREFPSGKGFADVVFIPRYDKPAMIIELKYNQDADTAIKQIKEKKYFFGLEKYLDNLLLVGINYDKETKKHSCVIEKYES